MWTISETIRYTKVYTNSAGGRGARDELIMQGFMNIHEIQLLILHFIMMSPVYGSETKGSLTSSSDQDFRYNGIAPVGWYGSGNYAWCIVSQEVCP